MRSCINYWNLHLTESGGGESNYAILRRLSDDRGVSYMRLVQVIKKPRDSLQREVAELADTHNLAVLERNLHRLQKSVYDSKTAGGALKPLELLIKLQGELRRQLDFSNIGKYGDVEDMLEDLVRIFKGMDSMKSRKVLCKLLLGVGGVELLSAEGRKNAG